MLTKFLNYIEYAGALAKFTINSLKACATPPYYFNEIIKIASSLTLKCLLPVIAVVSPFGMVVALQGMNITRIFGADHLLSSLIAVSLLRELSPGVTSIMVASQAGSYVASELGTAKIKEEISALTIMSIDSYKFLIVPRMIGIIFACVITNSIASIFGIAGGYFVAVFLKGLSHANYMDNLMSFSNIFDVLVGPIKTGIYGFVIAIFATFHGVNVKTTSLQIGRAVNKTVVHSIIVFIFLNYFLTTIFFKLTKIIYGY